MSKGYFVVAVKTALFTLALVPPHTLQAQVYSCVDRTTGHTTFTDQPCDSNTKQKQVDIRPNLTPLPSVKLRSRRLSREASIDRPVTGHHPSQCEINKKNSSQQYRQLMPRTPGEKVPLLRRLWVGDGEVLCRAHAAFEADAKQLRREMRLAGSKPQDISRLRRQVSSLLARHGVAAGREAPDVNPRIAPPYNTSR